MALLGYRFTCLWLESLCFELYGYVIVSSSMAASSEFVSLLLPTPSRMRWWPPYAQPFTAVHPSGG
eukprot:131784-Amphidinium_carterae.3